VTHKEALLKVIGILMSLPTPLLDEQMDAIGCVLYRHVSLSHKNALIEVLRIVTAIPPIEMGPRNQSIYLILEQLADPDVSFNPTPWALAHNKEQNAQKIARYERAFRAIAECPLEGVDFGDYVQAQIPDVLEGFEVECHKCGTPVHEGACVSEEVVSAELADEGGVYADHD
jgi:hypothetical protein